MDFFTSRLWPLLPPRRMSGTRPERLKRSPSSGSRTPPGFRRLALLLLLTGCATQPTRGSPSRYEHNSLPTAQNFVEVDFETPSPQQAETLRQRGVQLPTASSELAEPRAHRDFVDRRVTAVGFSITAGGYLLYCEGLPLPVLVPESHVDLGLLSAEPLSPSIYPNRDSALEDMADSASKPGGAGYAWYRGASGALIVPTLFSPASTPRIAATMLEVRKHLSETVERELKVLLVSLTGTRLLQGVFSRVLRVGSEPALPPVARPERLGGQAPAPRPSAQAPAPAPAPGALTPSAGLVQALTGKNPTPPIAAGPRLPQDVAVSPTVPRKLPTNRPVSSSLTQNAQIQADIDYLQDIGAKNIRVNQQQLTVENKQRVGVNRPDLQFDYKGRRYHVEYDTPTSGRGPRHQGRTTSNDPNAEIILLIVP
jgi:hypothetical protein